MEMLTPDERARRDSLQQRAVTISRQLDDLTVGGDPADVAALRRQRAGVDAGLQDLDLDLRERLRTGGPALPHPSEVARRLAAGTVVMGWFDVAITADGLDSWAWILTPEDGLHWVRLPDGHRIADLAARYRAAVVQDGMDGPVGPVGPGATDGPGATGTAGATGDQIADLARELFRLRLEPGLPWLRHATTLVAVPGSALAGVPLSTLITDDGRTVHRRWSLVVSPRPSSASTRDLPAPSPAAQAGRLLAVADPPFRPEHLAAMDRDERHVAARGAAAVADGANAASHRPEAAVNRSVLTDLVRGDRGQLHRLARLPATRREVTTVAGLFPHADLLLGEAAAERSLVRRQRSGELAHYDFIHLATHALVDADRPGRSALVLSQLDRHAATGGSGPRDDLRDGPRDGPRDARLDGLLTAEEITAGWRLNADLVTLSACETGLGRPAPGEGYLGFTQAFLTAGARSVLVSLWQVDDRATALLMERFYANLRERGLGKAAALQEAQIWLQRYEVAGRRPFAAPRHWGAFVLVGEG